MFILIVDDEEPALRMAERAIKEVKPEARIACFSMAKSAVDYAKENRIDVAFLDIEMPNTNGLSMAKELKKINPMVNIIFVTGYSSYLEPAFQMHASGYVLKPIRSDRVGYELENLRHPVEPLEQGVRVQCFGSFGVFLDGEPILFPRAKAKELLAYLVHKKGATASTMEIAAVLWEDKEYNHSLQVQTQRAITNLIKLLEEMGLPDLIIRGWNSMAVDVKKFSCDYYNYLNDKSKYEDTFVGEYLMEYSWGEATLAYLRENGD